MIPLRDQNPTRKVPYVNYTLIVLNILIFLWEWTTIASGATGLVRELGVVPAELTEAPGREAFTLVTSMFLHDPGNLSHLAFNMLFLYIFGDNVEDALGHWRYVLFYLVAGLAAASAQVLFDPESAVPMIGASGAIGGVLGAYVVLYPRAPVTVLNPFFPLWFIFGVFLVFPAWLVVGEWFLVNLIGLQSGDAFVAFAAHIGGFIAGLLLVRPLMRGRRRRDVDAWKGWRPPRRAERPRDLFRHPERRDPRRPLEGDDDGPRRDPWLPPDSFR